jgi:small nuclear ribonucleoprotein (snRNP)-like protein
MGTIDVSTLRALEGHRVRVRLRDESEHVGRLRTELLTDRSISVFLTGEAEGRDAVVYIDQIVALEPA